MTAKLSALYALAAGVTSAVASTLIDVKFWQAVIIACITGLIAGIGTIVGAAVAAYISARATGRLHDHLDDVKGIVGANRRDTDRPGGS